MTRLVTTGWETGDVAEIGVAGGTSTQVVVTATPTPRSPGSYCIKFGAASGNAYRDIVLPAALTDVWVRFGLNTHALNVRTPFLQFVDSSGSGFQGTVAWDTDTFLKAYRGAQNGTLLGASTNAWTQDQWRTVDVRWQITSTTVGIVEVWVDGTQWLNLTGVDNTNTTTANVQTVRIGSFASSFGATIWEALDDLAVNDTAGTLNNARAGDGRVVLLKPNGAGSNTNQTRGGTDSGANWSQCDELPPSLTDYVYSATAGTRDTYALEDLPAGTWTVNACEVLAYAQNSDALAGSLGLTVKSGSTTNEGTARTLSATAAYVRQLYETDPATSAAWTASAVNALEAGTTVR